jgi:hypothetical protein
VPTIGSRALTRPLSLRSHSRPAAAGSSAGLRDLRGTDQRAGSMNSSFNDPGTMVGLPPSVAAGMVSAAAR